jgi:hypothetical protein
LLRSIAVRLARAGGGGVEYWLGLPIFDLFQYVVEFVDQAREDNEAAEASARRR